MFRFQVDDPGAAAHRLSHKMHQVVKRVDLRPYGIYDHILAILRHVNRHLGQVSYKDGPELVIARAGHRKHRKAFEYPGDIVDKDVPIPEDQSWPDYGVGEPGAGNLLLQERLASKIRKRRRLGVVGDAMVHDPADTSFSGCPYQRARICYG